MNVVLCVTDLSIFYASTVCASFTNTVFFCILLLSLHLAHNMFVRHGGPQARARLNSSHTSFFHYFVIEIQWPPTPAINPTSPHLQLPLCLQVQPCLFMVPPLRSFRALSTINCSSALFSFVLLVNHVEKVAFFFFC